MSNASCLRCPEDISCKAKIVINCECGHLSQEVTCNATMENALEMKNRKLKCNDFCALAERNRKLANALEITDRVGDGYVIVLFLFCLFPILTDNYVK